jgi:hypothetical protein
MKKPASLPFGPPASTRVRERRALPFPGAALDAMKLVWRSTTRGMLTRIST